MHYTELAKYEQIILNHITGELYAKKNGDPTITKLGTDEVIPREIAMANPILFRKTVVTDEDTHDIYIRPGINSPAGDFLKYLNDWYADKEFINKKNSHAYTIAGFGISATNSSDGELQVVYTRDETVYVRELQEFFTKFKVSPRHLTTFEVRR